MGLFFRGRLELARNRPAEAVATLQKVITDEPKLAPAHYFLGLAHLRNQDPARAKTALAEAIKLAPNVL